MCYVRILAHSVVLTRMQDEDGNVEESEEGGRIFRLQPHWPATSKSSISCIRLDPLDARNVRHS